MSQALFSDNLQFEKPYIISKFKSSILKAFSLKSLNLLQEYGVCEFGRKLNLIIDRINNQH